MNLNFRSRTAYSKYTFLAIGLLFSGFVSGQSKRKYTPREMRQDIDSMVRYLQNAHPNPFYRYPKAAFLKDVERVKAGLHKSLDKVAFYLAIEPLLGKLEDGHTDLHINQYYHSLNPVMLPYNFKLSTRKPYIICTGANHGIEAKLPAEAEILSINNIPALKIVNDIIVLNTGETPLFRAEFGATRFYFYLEALYKAHGIYHIRYKGKGLVHYITLRGIRKDVLDKSANDRAHPDGISEPTYSLQLLNGNETALINFRSFDWDGFKAFADSAFKVIKEKEVKNLIINLMDDGGGNSDVGDEFFKYILDKPFTQYAKVVEKNSALLKERLREHRIGKSLDSADKTLLGRRNGSIDTAFYDDIGVNDNPLRFNGRVILLVNVETYSSAADFAQCFRHYKRGVVIGEETGGLIKSYGDIVTAHLPNTQLELSISSKLYYDAGAGENDWHGVIPDIKSPSADALKRALKYIDAQENRH
jgi:hypothetical protein